MQDRISVALSIVRRLGLLACILVLLTVLPARADVRVALVVGVSAYVNAPVLRNTTSDATAVGAALERLGFAVDVVLDPNKAALDSAIRRTIIAPSPWMPTQPISASKPLRCASCLQSPRTGSRIIGAETDRRR